LDKDLLLRELKASFVGELDDQLQSYNAELLALEKEGAGASAERVKTLFRVAHTIKGGARAIEALGLADLAHDLEDALALVRAAPGSVDREAFRELLAALFVSGDAIAVARAALGAGAAVDASQLAPARQTLARWIAEHGPRLSDTAPSTGPAAAAPAGRTTEAPGSAVESDTGARIQSSRLDALLGSSGELLIAVRRAEQRIDAVSQLAAELLARGLDPRGRTRATDTADSLVEKARALAAGVVEAGREQWSLADTVGRLDEEIQSLRLLPFLEAVAGIDRVARDAAQGEGKQVDLAVEGGDVLLDRAIIEELRDPLRHLVRNAVDHGIEPAAERRAAGKPERGRVTVAARVQGASIGVTVADDGRGVDVPRVRAELARRGVVDPDGPQAVERLLFEAGFSTAARVTGVSGRGVGLDVVRSRVQAMRGQVALSYTAGGGTTVRLTVPLTLSRVRVVLLRVGDQVLAVPSHQVESLRRVTPDDLPLVEGRRRLRTTGTPLAVSSLGSLLGIGAAPAALPARITLAVLVGAAATAAILVDELLDELALTVKRLPRRLQGARHLSGASILPDGRVALILDVPALVESALTESGADPVAAAAKPARQRKRVLLVDDSITTRGLERSILEAAGYDVLAASDGAEAWRLLQEHGADILVSDIEMPNLDGFQLTERVRRTTRFARLPIVLVTGLTSESDRARGLELGADAYLVKTAFQQSSLVETVADLVRS
jgi:two-component system chemotaxis sensor kinase CheA